MTQGVTCAPAARFNSRPVGSTLDTPATISPSRSKAMSPQELLTYLRDQICKQVLDEPG